MTYKIDKDVVEKIERLRERKDELFDFAHQIEFVAENIDFFERRLKTMHLKRGIIITSIDNPIKKLKWSHQIKFKGFSHNQQAKIANFLLTTIPDFLLGIAGLRTITLHSDYILIFQKTSDGKNDYSKIPVRFEITGVHPHNWPEDYILAHTVYHQNDPKAKHNFIDWGAEIEFWPSNGYTTNERVQNVYLIYMVLHELFHTIFNVLKTPEFKNSELDSEFITKSERHALSEFFNLWLDACQQDPLPVSWYSGVYAPTILDAALDREVDFHDLMTALNEEAAEWFAWYLMGMSENPWRNITMFRPGSTFKGPCLRKNSPNPKWQLIQGIWQKK